jgi:hypothetical protein
MSFVIDWQKLSSPSLGRKIDTLTGGDLTGLHSAMITGVQEVTVNHLTRLAGERHATADRLGAAPTGHLAQAAEKVASPACVSASSRSGTLTINHPGLTRALRDVTISRADGGPLTIPVDAIAYGRRAAELWEPLNLFYAQNSKGQTFIAMKSGKTIKPLYLLVRSVTQHQDRSLLPADNEFAEAAHDAADAYVTALVLGEKAAGLL